MSITLSNVKYKLMLNPNTMQGPVQLYGFSMNKKKTLHTFESQRINSMID